MEKRFTRYSEFEAQFNINLKNYAQSKVKGGNKGDYYQFLVSLRELLQLKKVDTKKDIEELVKSKGLNTSIPGFCQVLEGIGVISKIKDKGYVFWPNRIDNRLAEFLFEYNHFKQRVLNNRNFEDDVREMFLFQFGKFEESITGVNTYKKKKRKQTELEKDEELRKQFPANIEGSDEFYKANEFVETARQCNFSDALTFLKNGYKVKRSEWGDSYICLIENYSVVKKEIKNDKVNVKMFDNDLIYQNFIGFKNSFNHFCVFCPNQDDLLSEDWIILV